MDCVFQLFGNARKISDHLYSWHVTLYSCCRLPAVVHFAPKVEGRRGVSRPTARQKGRTDAVTAQSFAPIAARFLKPRGERLKLQLELDLGQDTRSWSKQTLVLSASSGVDWKGCKRGLSKLEYNTPNLTILDQKVRLYRHEPQSL